MQYARTGAGSWGDPSGHHNESSLWAACQPGTGILTSGNGCLGGSIRSFLFSSQGQREGNWESSC